MSSPTARTKALRSIASRIKVSSSTWSLRASRPDETQGLGYRQRDLSPPFTLRTYRTMTQFGVTFLYDRIKPQAPPSQAI